MSATTTAPAREFRAFIYAAATLHAPVRILGDLTRTRVWVETLPGGVGGWARPRKRLLVSAALLRDVTEFTPAPTVEPVAEPAPVPVAEVSTEDVPAQEDTRSPELVAAEADLAALNQRIAAHWDSHHGTSRLRGKQHNIRVDAAIKRAARMAQQHRVLSARVERLRATEA